MPQVVTHMKCQRLAGASRGKQYPVVVGAAFFIDFNLLFIECND